MCPANIYSKFLCLNVELNNKIITPKILQIHHSEVDIFLSALHSLISELNKIIKQETPCIYTVHLVCRLSEETSSFLPHRIIVL